MATPAPRRALDDPAALARAARLVRVALERKRAAEKQPRKSA